MDIKQFLTLGSLTGAFVAGVFLWGFYAPYSGGGCPQDGDWVSDGEEIASLRLVSGGAEDFASLCEGTSPRTPPTQGRISDENIALEQCGYELIPRVTYVVDARVLAVRIYRRDEGSGISPIDIALGWGELSESSVVEKLDFSQRNRWYYPSEASSDWKAVSNSSSNHHLIPASREVWEVLKRVRRGDRIRLCGWLVDVRGDGGWSWKTSLSRSDTGGGACEIVLVDRAKILGEWW